MISKREEDTKLSCTACTYKKKEKKMQMNEQVTKWNGRAVKNE